MLDMYPITYFTIFRIGALVHALDRQHHVDAADGDRRPRDHRLLHREAGDRLGLDQGQQLPLPHAQLHRAGAARRRPLRVQVCFRR